MQINDKARGLKTFGQLILLLAGIAIGMLASTPILAQEVAGKVVFLKGTAWVQEGARRKPLEEDSVIYAGDQLRTGRKTNLHMRFLDETLFTLGPGSKMNVEAYDERDTAENGFVTRVLQGAFRFVSGLLARKNPQNFKVHVTVGTIGIRGTHVAGEVVERHEADGSVVEASAKVVLLEDEEQKDTAIVVSNEFGSVEIDEPGYGTEIPDENSPPSPVRRMQLRSTTNLLRAIRGSMRRRLP